MMWDYGYGYGAHPAMWGGPDVFGAIFSVIWIVIIVMAIVWAVRFLRHSRNKHWALGSSALDVLKERYAKGEIDTAEYEERKKVLEK